MSEKNWQKKAILEQNIVLLEWNVQLLNSNLCQNLKRIGNNM